MVPLGHPHQHTPANDAEVVMEVNDTIGGTEVTFVLTFWRVRLFSFGKLQYFCSSHL